MGKKKANEKLLNGDVDPPSDINANSSTEEYIDVLVDMQDFDFTAPLPSRLIVTKEKHAYKMGMTLLIVMAETLTFGLYRTGAANVVEVFKASGQVFGPALGIVFAYYFMVASRHGHN